MNLSYDDQMFFLVRAAEGELLWLNLHWLTKQKNEDFQCRFAA